jgi:inositol transport system substrate-binding protein
MSLPLDRRVAAAAVIAAAAAAGCHREPRPITVGVAFETLESEFWVANLDAIEKALAARGIRMLQAIADGDANRQYEQVRTFVARRVDGVIVAPKDANAVIPMIKAANAANIPFVIANRPPAPSRTKSITVSVDNFELTRATIDYLCGLARERVKQDGGRKRQALLLVGDLGDINALDRRRGFKAGAEACADALDVVAEVPTEWNLEKAFAGTTNALQAHPDIDFIYASADFLLPSVASALKRVGRWARVGDPGHVILGAFDGASIAHQMLRDGYLDADSVQDAFNQATLLVDAVFALRDDRPSPSLVREKGFVVHQGNFATMGPRMWGASFATAAK